jgi:HSP20 family protein
MVQWYYPSVFDEMAEVQKYMELLSKQMTEIHTAVLLPGPRNPPTILLPVQHLTINAVVTESEESVIVILEMIPCVSRENIRVDLINPRMLQIVCDQDDETQEGPEDSDTRRPVFRSFIRVIPLPEDVSELGSTASFMYGILEVKLKKTRRQLPGRIEVK